MSKAMNDLKECTTCCETKPTDEFYKCKKSPDGLYFRCKRCCKKRGSEYYQKNKTSIIKRQSRYYVEHLEHVKESKKRWRSENSEGIKKKKAQYYLKHVQDIKAARIEYNKKNKEKIATQRAKYRSLETSKEIKKTYEKVRSSVDIQYKLITNLRKRLLRALKGNYKKTSAKSLLGCSVEELKVYLESLFKPGMTWESHGIHGWHIDHIVPCSSFDLSVLEQQKQCFHYSNLQPLWAEENLKKSNKVSF